MFIKTLIMAGIFIDINHHLNLSEDRQMIIFILMGLAIVLDLFYDFLRKS